MMNKYNGGLDGNINGMYLPPTNGAIQMPYVGKAVASPKPDDKIVPYQHSIDEHFNKAPNAELNETADPGFATFDTKQFTDAVHDAVDPETRKITPATWKAITLQAAVENLKALSCINRNLIRLDKDVIEGNYRIEEAVRASAHSSSYGHGNTTAENMAALNALLTSPSGASSSTPSRYLA